MSRVKLDADGNVVLDADGNVVLTDEPAPAVRPTRGMVLSTRIPSMRLSTRIPSMRTLATRS